LGTVISAYTIASEAIVVTRAGVVLADELGAQDSLLVVRRGKLTFASIVSIDAAGRRTCQRLFTSLGDILLPDEAQVVARGGPAPAQSLDRELRNGRPVRLEVVSPTSWPRLSGNGSGDWAKFASLACGRLIAIPASAAAGLVEQAQHLLKAVGISTSIWEDERWVVLRPTKDARSPKRRPSVAFSTALQLLTAWDSAESGDVISRTRTGDSRVRARLVAALVNEALRYEVQWLPGYFPVEGRIRLAHDSAFPAFVPLKAARAEEGDVLTVAVEAEKASLVAGLLVVPPGRTVRS
jgi:hypothetical protein